MKRRRNMIILLCVLAVLIVVIIAERTVTRHVDSINITDEVILTLDEESLDSVSWEDEDGGLSFVRSDGVWTDESDEDFPVNQEAVAEFISWYEEVHADFIIDDVEDFSQYGLEEPQCTVTLSSGGEETVVTMGNYSTIDAQRYISIGDGKVYLVEDDPYEYITDDRDEFMRNDEVPAFDILTEMTVSGSTSLDAVYDSEGIYSYTDSYNYYNVTDGSYAALEDGLVESYLDVVSGLNLTDYVTYTASGEDLSQYGLDDPEFTLTVSAEAVVRDEADTEDDYDDETADEEEEIDITEDTETEPVEFVLYVGAVDSVEENDDGDEELITTGYALLGDSEIIYRLDSDTYESLKANSFDDLRPAAVLSPDWDTVTAVSVTFEDSTYDFRCVDAEEWAEILAAENADNEDEEEDSEETAEEEIDEDALYWLTPDDQLIGFDDVISAANSLRINDFTEDSEKDVLELSLTLTLDREAFDSVTVDIYRVDGDNCLVMTDGEVTGLMSRSLMVDLREAVTSIVLGL